MEMTENYKKIWEQNLADKVSKLERLKAENAKLREALQHIADHDEGLDSYFVNVAREALNDLRKGGE